MTLRPKTPPWPRQPIQPSALAPSLVLRLPSGGILRPFPSLSAAAPSVGDQAANLLSQAAPYLAASQVTLPLLGLAKTLVDVVKALDPAQSQALAAAVPQFLKAVKPLAPSLTMTIPGEPVRHFLTDLLGVAVVQLGDLAARLDAARDRLAVIEQAPATAAESAAQLNAALAAVGSAAATASVLSLATPFFAIMGMGAVNFDPPKLAQPADSAAVGAAAQAMRAAAQRLEDVAGALG